MNSLKKSDICIAVLTALIAQAVYLFTLAPTVTSEDSGELITAAYTFGVPHPPGYPLWCLLGKLFSFIYFLNPARGVNFMSSFFGSLTAGLLYIICIQLSLKRFPAIATSLCLAFSRTFWSQAVITEVYTLNTFLLCAVLVCIFLWKENKEKKFLYLASLFFGLGLTNHYMLMLLATPPILYYVFWQNRKIYTRYKPITGCSIIVLACLLIYTYLPIAASGEPPMNWGGTSTWKNFLDHVMRVESRQIEFTARVSPSIKLLYIGHFLRLFWLQFTPYILLPFVFLGWGYFRKMPEERLLFTGIFLFNTLVLILILRFTFEAENMTRMDEYYLPAYISTTIIIAGGFSRLLEVCKIFRNLNVMLALSLIAPLFPLLTHWQVNNMSGYYLAYDYNKAILESLEKDAIYFQAGDYNAFPTIYLHACEGIRPDIILADITGKLSKPAQEYLKSINPDCDLMDRRSYQSEIIEKGSRPVYFTAKSDVKDHSKYRLDPWGLVYRVRPKSSKDINVLKTFFDKEILRNITIKTSVDEMGESILSNYYLMYAETLVLQWKKDEAVEKYRLAERYTRFSKEGLNNIASTCAERGFLDEAERMFRESSQLYPGYLTGRRNLARLLETQGKVEEALKVYKELEELEEENQSLKRKIEKLQSQIRKEPGIERTKDLDEMLKRLLDEIEQGNTSAAVYNNLGNVYAEKGKVKEALEAYHKAIKDDPEYPMVYKNLSVFYRNELDNKELADYYMEKYRILKQKLERGE